MTNKEMLIEYFKQILSLSDERAKQEYLSIHQDKEIENDFVNFIENGWSKDCVEVQGFTAKKLNTDYPLSVLGAFNYLIYLRKDPKSALDNLKKGLPRR